MEPSFLLTGFNRFGQLSTTGAGKLIHIQFSPGGRRAALRWRNMSCGFFNLAIRKQRPATGSLLTWPQCAPYKVAISFSDDAETLPNFVFDRLGCRNRVLALVSARQRRPSFQVNPLSLAVTGSRICAVDKT